MTGTVLAQIIPFILSPVLGRIFSPEDFGKFAFYFSIASITGLVVSGKYEEAIPLPKSNFRAFLITLVSLISSLFASIILFLVLVLGIYFGVVAISNVKITYQLAIFLFLGAIAISMNQVLNYWFIREQKFKILSFNKASQSVLNGLFSISSGLVFKQIGLIISDFSSRIIVNLRLICLLFKSPEYHKFKKINSTKLKIFLLLNTAKYFKRYPIFLVPAGLMNTSAKQIPYIVLTSFYSPSLAGLLMMSQRVILSPLGVISVSFSQALLKPMADQLRIHGNCWDIYKKSLLTLLLIPLPIVLLGYFIIDQLVVVIFGKEWQDLSKVIFILTPYFYIYLVSGTLNITFIASGKQRLNLMMQALFLLIIVVTLTLSLIYKSDDFNVLKNLSLAYTLYFSITLIVSSLIARGKLNAR